MKSPECLNGEQKYYPKINKILTEKKESAGRGKWEAQRRQQLLCARRPKRSKLILLFKLSQLEL